MELSRTADALAAEMGRAGIAWRIALEDAQEHEAGERGQAEDQRRLPAGEIGGRATQLVARLPADVAGEFLHPISRAAHQIGELRRATVEVVGGGADGVGDVTGQVGSGCDLLIQKAFRLLIGVGGQHGRGFLGLRAGLLGDVDKPRDGFTCFGADSLIRCRLCGSYGFGCRAVHTGRLLTVHWLPPFGEPTSLATKCSRGDGGSRGSPAARVTDASGSLYCKCP